MAGALVLIDQDGVPPPKYAAFISYSHLDLATAKRLHRQLERYRIPQRLVGSATTGGPPNNRLRPIFRDIDELPASDDLSAEIQAALTASAALIVVASPAAKASRWVAREIETFRALHGTSRPVLIALIDGEPGTAFPESLEAHAIEPVAADFRKGHDGRRLALLKLVAGLTGVSLDSLVQRDAQARLRRVTAITVAALIAVVVMAGLLVVTLRARAEADRQRNEAEGLVEYMLTDLREKLKGVDRLDVMTGVNERAMAYYGGQRSLDALAPESLIRRARLLHAMGEDDEKGGRLDAAMRKFAEAHRTTASALANKPRDAATMLVHAQSEYWLGLAFQRQEKPQEAIAKFKAYLRLLVQYGRDGGEPKVEMRETGWAHNALGAIHLRQLAQPEVALGHFRLYLTAFEALAKLEPKNNDNRYNIADANGWLADSYFAISNMDAARKHREAQSVILKRLLEIDPNNGVWLLELIATERSLFRIYYRKQDFVKAAVAIGRAEQLLASRSIDQTNRAWLLQQSYVAMDRAFLAAKTSRGLEACANRAAAIRAYRKIERLPNRDVIEDDRFAASLRALSKISEMPTCTGIGG